MFKTFAISEESSEALSGLVMDNVPIVVDGNLDRVFRDSKWKGKMAHRMTELANTRKKQETDKDPFFLVYSLDHNAHVVRVAVSDRYCNPVLRLEAEYMTEFQYPWNKLKRSASSTVTGFVRVSVLGDFATSVMSHRNCQQLVYNSNVYLSILDFMILASALVKEEVAATTRVVLSLPCSKQTGGAPVSENNTIMRVLAQKVDSNPEKSCVKYIDVSYERNGALCTTEFGVFTMNARSLLKATSNRR